MWALTGLAVLIMLLAIGLNDSREIAAAKRAGGEDETRADAMNAITAKYIQFSGAGYNSAVAEAMR